MEWLNNKWDLVILWALSVFGLAWRNEYKTNQLHKAMFDRYGAVRFPTIMNCDKCRAECQMLLRKDLQEMKEMFRGEIQDLKGLVGQLITREMDKYGQNRRSTD